MWFSLISVGIIPNEATSNLGFGVLVQMIRDFNNLDLQRNAILSLILKENRGVKLALSGGLDSTALLGLFCDIRDSKKNFDLQAFHVNYGLRGAESDADERHISALCAVLVVPLEVHRITAAQRESRRGEGIQEWARRLRRAIAAKYAASGYIIALAHHRDDLTENALLRLARGVSPGYMGGLKIWDPPLWRPLLEVRKAELAAYLTQRGMTHREDASNATLEYDRNVIRHRIIPELEKLFPGAAERIASFALDAEDLSFWSDEVISREANQHIGSECKWLCDLPRGAARHALASLIRTRAPGYRQLSRPFLDKALEAMHRIQNTETQTKTWSRDMPGGGRILIKGCQILIEPSQHDRAHRDTGFEALLGPGSHALISLGEASCRLNGPLSPNVSKVYGTLAPRP